MEIVKLSAGEVTNLYNGGKKNWGKPFHEGINSGDVVEIRFRKPALKFDVNCLETRLVHINLNEGEKYALGQKYEDDRKKCQFILYKYFEKTDKGYWLLNEKFLRDTDRFPLFQID